MFSIDRATITIIAIRQILALEPEPTDERWTQAEDYLRDEFADERQQAVADRGDLQAGGDDA